MNDNLETRDTREAAGPEGTIESPGGMLLAEREARGLTIHQVASELHVNDRLLESLENDRYDNLGAPIFVKGHLRNYARLLGLDPAEVITAYEHQTNAEPPELVSRQGEGTPMETATSGAWFAAFSWFLVAVLLFATIGWWYYQQEIIVQPEGELTIVDPSARDSATAVEPAPATDSDRQADPLVDDPRARLQQPAEVDASGEAAGEVDEDAGVMDSESTDTDAAEAEAVSAEPTGSSARPRPQPGTGARDVSAATQQPAASAAGPEPSAATAQPTTTSSQPPAGGSVQVEFVFAETSWIEVHNAADEVLLYDLVPEGQSRSVTAGGELRVFLGNAPAVSISVDGEQFDVGQYVRRDNTARFRISPE